jgi:feruloyl esterase
MRFRSGPLSLVATVFLMMAGVSLAQAATCESLASLVLSDATITSVEMVPRGNFTLSGGRGGARQISDLPAFCRVAATLTPSSDSNIRIELWMPEAENWNGKYLAVGNGAFAGSVSTNALIEPLRRGYAASSTDTGHVGGSGSFALNEELLIDFAHRAVHEMAVHSKTVIEMFYDAGPSSSIFNGCSTGGRQALATAQRYPTDFDGIIAGAPANYPTHLQGAQVWMGQFAHETPSGPLSSEKLEFLHDSVVASCDMNDGVGDGVIENPGMCRFESTALRYRCPLGEDGSSCLTLSQGEVAARMYQGPKTSGGASLFPGLAMGSELLWAGAMGRPSSLAIDTFRYLVHKDEGWDEATFDVEADVALAEEVIGPTMDSMDPDISAFVENGGRLLIYHGWADWGISPQNSINYYESVMGRLGSSVDDSVRLFMLPGVGHCRGGEGPDTFDSIGVMDDWVTSGVAPSRISVSRVREGEVDRTRPLCAFPQTAAYDGTGSTDDESNFTCQ